jgi:hypothetical protein
VRWRGGRRASQAALQPITVLSPLSSSRPTATDAELVAERDRLLAGAARLEAALDEARARADADAGAAARERAARGAPDESQVWASHLVVLQDTLRMHREEAGAAEVELAGRARMAAAAAERAAAEAAGRAAAARARAQLLATEARIDRLKMELYFPKVKGYSFAVGGKGIYFGGKDIVVAEGSGPVAFDVCPPRASVGDGRSATLEIRAGGFAADTLAAWAAPTTGDGVRPAGARPPPRALSATRSAQASPLKQRVGSAAASPVRGVAAVDAPSAADAVAAAVAAASASPAKAAALAAAQEAPLGLPPRPPTSASAAAAAAERAGGGARSRALAARFLTRIGSARSLERYARKAAMPHGPVEAWPGAEDEGPGVASAPRPAKRSLAARLLPSRSARRERKARERALPRGASVGSLLGGGSASGTDAATATAAALELAAAAADGASLASDDDDGAPPSFDGLESSSSEGEGGAAGDAGHLGAARAPPAPTDFGAAPVPPRRPPSVASSRAGPGSSSAGGGRGGERRLRVVVRLSDVALVGERGSRCPSLAVAELAVELEISGMLGCRYTRGEGWRALGAPAIEVHAVHRAVRGASVPVPRALLRLIVGSVLPPVFQRLLLGALPGELGEYLLAAGAGAAAGGDLTLVGPPLATLDIPLAPPPVDGDGAPPAASSKDAARAARRAAAAAEARGALGLGAGGAAVLDALTRGGAVGGGSGGALCVAPLTRRPHAATRASLARLRARYARHPKLWASVTAAWDAAAKALAAATGVPPPPPLDAATAAAAAGLTLKPVRASLVLTHLDAGCNVDAAVAHVRAFFERQARELSVKAGGGGAPTTTTATTSTVTPGLAIALSALEAWHAFVIARLAGFKARFRGASARVVAAVDARGVRLGAEAAKYVGPLSVRLPVALRPGCGADDGWCFDVPLPDPSSYAIKRFVDAIRSAAASPAERGRGDVGAAPPAPATPAGTALGWFSDAATAERPGPPTRLGTLSVDGARARVRLDEAALAELLGAAGPGGNALGAPAAGAVRLARTAAGVLAALGDVARVSFAPAAGGGETGNGFVLVAESAAAAALHADVAGLTFATAPGVTPGRLVRLAHGLARAVALAAAKVDGPAGVPPSPAVATALASLDARFEAAHSVLARDALDASACLDGGAAVEGGALMLRVRGAAPDAPGDDPPPPIALANDVELVTLFGGKAPGVEDG